MVAPVASQIMSEILPLLGVEPDYTAEELVGADTTVPNVVGQTREAAEDRLADLGFTFHTVGTGTRSPTRPRRRHGVPGNASIISYLGQEAGHPCTVPNVVGRRLRGQQGHHQRRTYHEGDRYHHNSSGNVYAITQSLPAGWRWRRASTVVTVQFGDNSVLDE